MAKILSVNIRSQRTGVGKMGFIKALLILLFALLIIVVYFYFQYEKKPVSNNSPSATSTAVTEVSNTPAPSSPSSEPPASAEPSAQPSASSEQSATPAPTAAAAPSPAASRKMPADDQGVFTKGVEHFNRMDYDKAIVCFREVTAKNPKNIFAHYQLFLCYVQTEPAAWTKKSNAFREAKQIMSLKPDDQMKKQIDTYFKDVATRESTVIEPAPIKASPSKGPSGTPSKSPSGTPTVAPTPTETETASAPPPLGQNGGVPTISNKDADMHYERARNYDKIGNYRFAVAEYTAAIKINSKHFDAYVSRGSLYESKGEYGNAAGDYTKAISLKPQDAKSYYRRAMLYKTMQDRDKAKADLQRTKELDSSMSDKVDLVLKELEAQK
jgi:tetratricopeptide (TPR) repeat protein